MEIYTVIVFAVLLMGCSHVQFIAAFTSGDKKVIDTSMKKCSFNCYGHIQKNCIESHCNVIVNIPCIHRCDGDLDCPNGADERNCSVTTDAYPKDDGIDDGKMAWLKTTVYTVIVCTVGIVLLISVIVIGICRMKMKRAAIRRTLCQAERRRHHSHSNHCDGQESRSRRSEHIENEPFISAPSPTHFGNIIVNVNNGVQYVPSSDFGSSVQSPPSYLEVMAESGIVGRHSPPPEYSTIDRNPNTRTPQSPSESNNMQLVSENTATNSTSEPTAASRRVSSQNAATNEPGVLHNSISMEDESTSNMSQTADSSNITVQGTQSLGRRPPREQRSQANRSVRQVASPRRPKQLKVCEGQIVLDDNSSNSSSPETVNRNTQTNLADISCQSGAKPAQLQVLGGQIILSSQEAEVTVQGEHSDGAVAQGQLDVKDGHIVFKPSES